MTRQLHNECSCDCAQQALTDAANTLLQHAVNTERHSLWPEDVASWLRKRAQRITQAQAELEQSSSAQRTASASEPHPLPAAQHAALNDQER